MKKSIAALVIACLLLCTAGCSILKPAEKVFTVDTYGLQITADSSFQENTGGAFDLQITNDNAYISIMAYRYIDLPEGCAPADVFKTQNDDLLGKRDGVVLIQPEQTQTVAQRQVTQALYSGERNGVKNYYATYLVDIPEAETCAWVLVTAAPSYFTANQEHLNDIVLSLTTIN